MSTIINDKIEFTLASKKLPTEGNLAWEYNPFRNYRLTESKFLYKDVYYTEKELKENFGIYWNNGGVGYENEWNWYDESGNIISDQITLYGEEGTLVDFNTKELNFDITRPIDISPQYSYDNSVNLIINDGINTPKIINSRFSALGRNTYEIVDRKGNNDTNIYNSGESFDTDVSLYKKFNNYIKVNLEGVFTGGQLGIGNYHFYFKYVDSDGNETDFMGESGLVSVFIGNSARSVRTGFRQENSQKLVKFTLDNIDNSYQTIKVYYSVNSGSILQSMTTNCFEILDTYSINAKGKTTIIITGFENTREIPESELNIQYIICENVQTQAICQNRLFFGNIKEPEIPYQLLKNASLCFTPNIKTEQYIPPVDYKYKGNNLTDSYYNSNFIYNKTGYWPDEIYRFGIVYILSNNTTTSVFNVRGGILNNISFTELEDLIDNDSFTNKSVIEFYEDSFLLKKGNTQKIENSKGVVQIDRTQANDNGFSIFGINFTVDESVLKVLKEIGIKGYFFVRQKRIPTTLCQTLIMGIDPESRTPIIPITTNSSENKYITESFISQDENKQFTKQFDKRMYSFDVPEYIEDRCGICPEYDVDYPFYNNIFTGDTIKLIKSLDNTTSWLSQDDYNKNYFYADNTQYKRDYNTDTVDANIMAIQDGTKAVSIGQKIYSAMAGEASEAFRFEYISSPEKSTNSTNLLRGVYGPYIAIDGDVEMATIYDVKIPGYDKSLISDYFKIRYNDNSEFYRISDNISIDISNPNTCFRGDCYICQFTHRVNRNFQDPDLPTNDWIIDANGWKDNFEMERGVINMEKFSKINRSDLNAVRLGMYVTFTFRSSKNLNIRSIDESNVGEVALTGLNRTFYPQCSLDNPGVNKIPEALCYNKGFESSVSRKIYTPLPDAPAYQTDFSNRIVYSDVQLTNAFQNSFRVFRGTNYQDYPKTYGSITKLVEWHDNLICVYEHGVDLIPVKERVQTGEGEGGNIFIQSDLVLPERAKNLSNKFGSQWKDSIIATSNAIYGVDTIGKKIWRTNGNTFEVISDKIVQEFLNNNITITERELTPIIGIRNVKTHYNAFKNDVMFTFYNDLYNIEEKAWNLCYNESLGIFTTFYSWIPSFSNNIYNSLFTFDRNTSKYITKLAMSSNSIVPNAITFEENIIEPYNGNNYTLSNLHISDLKDDQVASFELIKPSKFVIQNEDGSLSIIKSYKDLCYEKYIRVYKDKDGNKYDIYPWDSEFLSDNLSIKIDERGRQVTLKMDPRYGVDTEYTNKVDDFYKTHFIIYYVRIKAKVSTKSEQLNIKESLNNLQSVDAGYYTATLAIIPKYNMQFLTTDFWKHGQAGIIDISEKPKPTYWYGTTHPFEFEFVVNDNMGLHKIFNNLEIISNKAEPESFHYEIIGECFDFANDKKNIYIRQEALKELYQHNGSDVTFDHNYKYLNSYHRPIQGTEYFDKSTIFPGYYYRQDTINEIEDAYHSFNDENTKNYNSLSGAEIVRYENLDEYRIVNHAKGVKTSGETSRLQGNMEYVEDKWRVVINPINLVQKNESKEDWINKYKLNSEDPDTFDQVPVELNLKKDFTIPEERDLTIPDNWTRNIVIWNDLEYNNKEVKIKDKFVKIRIRYSGKDLAIISAIKTLYAISYG